MISDSDTINVENSYFTVAQVSGIFSASSGIFNATSCTILSFIRVANTIGSSLTYNKRIFEVVWYLSDVSFNALRQ